MKTLPAEARIRNVSGKERCHWCRNARYVVAALRKPARFVLNGRGVEPVEGEFHEEVGPCPFCEAGFAEEFPESPKVKPPWGEDGFWAPLDDVQLVPEEEPGARPLPWPQQREKAREALKHVGGIGRQIPEPEAGVPDERPGLLDG